MGGQDDENNDSALASPVIRCCNRVRRSTLHARRPPNSRVNVTSSVFVDASNQMRVGVETPSDRKVLRL